MSTIREAIKAASDIDIARDRLRDICRRILQDGADGNADYLWRRLTVAMAALDEAHLVCVELGSPSYKRDPLLPASGAKNRKRRNGARV